MDRRWRKLLFSSSSGPNAKTDKVELNAISKWLTSYNFSELFSDAGGFTDEIKNLVPEVDLRMGDSKYTMGDLRLEKI